MAPCTPRGGSRLAPGSCRSQKQKRRPSRGLQLHPSIRPVSVLGSVHEHPSIRSRFSHRFFACGVATDMNRMRYGEYRVPSVSMPTKYATPLNQARIHTRTCACTDDALAGRHCSRRMEDGLGLAGGIWGIWLGHQTNQVHIHVQHRQRHIYTVCVCCIYTYSTHTWI